MGITRVSKVWKIAIPSKPDPAETRALRADRARLTLQQQRAASAQLPRSCAAIRTAGSSGRRTARRHRSRQTRRDCKVNWSQAAAARPLALTGTSLTCDPRAGSAWSMAEMAVAADHPPSAGGGLAADAGTAGIRRTMAEAATEAIRQKRPSPCPNTSQPGRRRAIRATTDGRPKVERQGAGAIEAHSSNVGVRRASLSVRRSLVTRTPSIRHLPFGGFDLR
jgi:hypothetical protein